MSEFTCLTVCGLKKMERQFFFEASLTIGFVD